MVDKITLDNVDRDDKYRKVKTKKPEKETNPENQVEKLEKKVEYLEAKITALTLLFDQQNKSFDEFLGALRRAQLQDVRAKEKAYNMIGANNLQSGLKMFMDESRRSDLQMVSYSSKKIGMDYKPTKYKYGEKTYNLKKS